jgi:hypothetical protein
VPLRTLGIVVGLLVAFLTAALAPCPARVEVGDARARPARASPGSADAVHTHDADAAEVALVAACPCGCERAPVAGASARLGAALPSASQRLVVAVAATPATRYAARPLDGFVPSIEHVPLPASI